jgi:hypothetical protein
MKLILTNLTLLPDSPLHTSAISSRVWLLPLPVISEEGDRTLVGGAVIVASSVITYSGNL